MPCKRVLCACGSMRRRWRGKCTSAEAACHRVLRLCQGAVPQWCRGYSRMVFLWVQAVWRKAAAAATI